MSSILSDLVTLGADVKRSNGSYNVAGPLYNFLVLQKLYFKVIEKLKLIPYWHSLKGSIKQSLNK